eukprot:365625-Chlamydomonas_euryale.AAC.17
MFPHAITVHFMMCVHHAAKGCEAVARLSLSGSEQSTSVTPALFSLVCSSSVHEGADQLASTMFLGLNCTTQLRCNLA